MQYEIQSIPDSSILVDGQPVSRLQVTREDGLVVTVNNPDRGYILEAFKSAGKFKSRGEVTGNTQAEQDWYWNE